VITRELTLEAICFAYEACTLRETILFLNGVHWSLRRRGHIVAQEDRRVVKGDLRMGGFSSWPRHGRRNGRCHRAIITLSQYHPSTTEPRLKIAYCLLWCPSTTSGNSQRPMSQCTLPPEREGKGRYLLQQIRRWNFGDIYMKQLCSF
jgi:hypothetical protein